jgi:hypothetical protein
LEEQGIKPTSANEDGKKKKKKSKDPNVTTLGELIGVKDIRHGIFEKDKNEYCVIISTDTVNFDLLNESAQSSIILGYQSLFKVIRFPVQLLAQAVRQDLRKEEKRFMENLESCNEQTTDYNSKVIRYIKSRSENEFRISLRIYYVVSYTYEVSRMAKLTPEQKERKIAQELWMRASTVIKMLKRARLESNLLDSLHAMEVMKRALNRDRMLTNPIESLVEAGHEKNFPYITADVTSLPGYENLVSSVEEVRKLVEETQGMEKIFGEEAI